MSINEVAGGIGSWSINLTKDFPDDIKKAIDYWGHIAIINGKVDPTRFGDQLLETANYVGVLRGRVLSGPEKSISGGGMELWLGDEDGKGKLFTEALTLTLASYTDAITAALPAAVTAGTIYNQTGLYSGTHIYQNSREILTYIEELYNCEHRVNGDGTLDSGAPEELYDPEPSCAITRRVPQGGVDLDLKALPGEAKLEADMEDFTTQTVLLAEGQEATTVTATAEIDPLKNPYKDIHGNPLVMTRVISESGTSEGNAQARATLQLNRFINPREAISLSTLTHDVKGDLRLGGFVWVEDQDALLYDLDNEVRFKGMILHPVKLRVTELAYPIESGQTVAYRHWDGTWYDLTDYVVFETGQTTVTVGGYARSLTGAGGPTEPIGRPVVPNTTFPDVPEWLPDLYVNSAYTSPTSGLTVSQLELHWEQPLNTDLSIISDGGYYEIRYRTSDSGLYPSTHDEMSAYDHDQLTGTFNNPIPYVQGAWNYAQVPWGTEQFLITDLTSGIPYDFQIRAVDNGTPPNASDWSTSSVVQTRPDTKAPEPPSAAEVAASRIAIQVVHRLGAATVAGDFTLDADIQYLEIHWKNEPTYEPDPTDIDDGGTMLGKLTATIAQLRSQTPVVGTFAVEDTTAGWVKVVAVDSHGNRSLASVGVQQTAELIDNAHISDLTVTKITAGFITSQWINSSEIVTGLSGSRMKFGYYGMEGYDPNNTMVFDFNTSDGSMYLAGTFESGVVGRRIKIAGGSNDIKFFPEVGETRSAQIFSYIPSNFPNDIALEMKAIDSDESDVYSRLYLLPDVAAIATSPLGEGGAFLSTSMVTAQGQSAFMTASTLNGTAPYVEGEADERARVSVVSTGTGTARMQTTDTDNNYLALIQCSGASIALEVHDGSTSGVEGGYLYLGSYTGSTYFGRHLSIGSDSWMEINEDGGYEFYVRNSFKGSIGLDGIGFSTYFGNDGGAGVDFRANIKAGGGNSIFFYWASGSIQIGSGASFVKTFVIDHPDDPAKHLVHATVEGPVAATEYFGTVEIKDHKAIVELPAYFESLTHEKGRTVHLTPILEDDSDAEAKLRKFDEGDQAVPDVVVPCTPAWSRIAQVASGGIKDGKLTIFCSGPDGTKVSWLVKAIRKDVEQFDVEPNKSAGRVRGDGPYTYFVEK